MLAASALHAGGHGSQRPPHASADPEHPLRAFGEAVEASESPELKRKREEMDLALGHKKRMLEFEFQDKKAELAAKKARFEQEAEAARTEALASQPVSEITHLSRNA